MTICNNKITEPDPTDPEVLSRASWVDAAVAYDYLDRGKAKGNKCALLLRSRLQKYLYKFGCFQQRHCVKVFILGVILLSMCAAGIRTVTIESDIGNLWVEEGGRLSEELAYTASVLGDGYEASSLIIVQTPKTDTEQSQNILTPKSLLQHVDAVVKATQTEVHLFNKIWRFEDLCYKATFPSTENGIIEMTLSQLLPCIIISPLDCFWEGSKPLGPRNPVAVPIGLFGFELVTWKSLDPMGLLNELGNLIPLDSYKEILERAGVSSAYQNKYCLNPMDPECPTGAPNYGQKSDESVAQLLNGGCSGFAPTYMQWKEDMILGGVVKNRSDVIVSAEAIQTVVQLLGERDFYELHKDTYAVSSINWTESKAKQILEVFQKKFTEVIVNFNKQDNFTDSISSFTQASLDELLESFSEMSYLKVGIGYGLMLLYCILTLMNCSNAVNSHAGVGIAGIFLVTLSVAAGLGICALLQLSFNAATTQIVPFLALGLGVDDMFLLAYTYAEKSSQSNMDHKVQAGELLKTTGITVMLTSIVNIVSFSAGAIIPIPALRVFCLQVAVLLLFNVLTMLLIYPAVLSIDAWRKSKHRVDVVCCCEAARSSKIIAISLSPTPPHSSETPNSPSTNSSDKLPSYDQCNSVACTSDKVENGVKTILAPPAYTETDVMSNDTYVNSSSKQNLTYDSSSICGKKNVAKCCSPGWLVRKLYLPLIHKKWFKIVVCFLSLGLLSLAIYGITKVENGMDLTEVVPRNTNVYTFVKAQSTYFGFYPMYIVTKDNFRYELPENQHLMKQLHQEISKLDNVIKMDDGTGENFWLDLMSAWLKDLQTSFDEDYSHGMFHKNGWYTNASDDAILAYKLLVQTGDTDNPIDKTKANYSRLVYNDGYIPSDAFYNYLTAWMYNDILAYDLSQAAISPEGIEWYHVPADNDLLIPKAPTITYARMSFFLHNLGNTESIVATINEVREICDKYVEKGLPNFPSGVVFTFWEQYVNIRFNLFISLLAVLASAFVLITLMLMNPLAAFFVVVILAKSTAELFGFMGLIGIQLSAIPVVILVASVGIGVEFTVHIMTGFLTAIGTKSIRISTSLIHMFSPVLYGAISTLLGVVMLAAADFEFIVKYFFLCLLALVVIGLYNGLVFFPILLSLCGPNGEIQVDDPRAVCLDPPTPPSVAATPQANAKRRRRSKISNRVESEASLSTISEETSHVSPNHELKIQPKVNIATTLTPTSIKRNCSPGCVNRRDGNDNGLTAKTTVTVEVHARLPGNISETRANSNSTDCRCAEQNETCM